MILVNKYILRILTGEFASAITLWPFIFLREQRYAKDPILINHEKIHLKQQLETLIVFFYLIYGYEYLRNRFRGMDSRRAYFLIRFEQEAYQFEKDLLYLSKRKMFAWLNI
ncbi:MAG: hypothetical protein IPI45_00505 [Saprospiraceae bacterium]|nr:hypothetical protein [Saprospiraceae bacterium]MBK7736236.1 hypothetical protein [Saprospiraceae bacterium]MBK7912398.1 hypothetical protein [Saprospiraceae bacterium]